MVSEFRRKKYLYVFNYYYDYNKDGSIDQNDIDALIKIATELRGWKLGDENYKTFEGMWRTVWEHLLSYFDADNDGVVTAEEWVQSWDKISKNQIDNVEWLQFWRDSVFNSIDNSKNGKISCDEFTAAFHPYGVDKTELETAFARISKENPEVSQAEFNELWTEYFRTDDPNDLGNFIYGKVFF